jgi:exodeoxyribonuclease VII large subunit
LKPTALSRDIAQKTERLSDRVQRLRLASTRSMQDRKRALDQWGARLSSLSHESALRRGFTLVRDAAGNLVRLGASLESGSGVELEFVDTRRQAVIDGSSSGSSSTGQKSSAKLTKPKTKKAKPPVAGQGTLF